MNRRRIDIILHFNETWHAPYNAEIRLEFIEWMKTKERLTPDMVERIWDIFLTEHTREED